MIIKKEMKRFPMTSKTIVLDMDQTLGELLECSPYGDIDPNRVVKVDEDGFFVLRPGARYFFEFCFRFFQNVVIFSAGEREYVHTVISGLLKGRGKGIPDAIFTHDDLNNGMKDLDIVFQNVPNARIFNTVAVDDYPEIYPPKYKYNVIPISDYNLMGLYGDVTPEALNSNDTALIDLTLFFSSEEFIRAPDVRPLIQSGMIAEYL